MTKVKKLRLTSILRPVSIEPDDAYRKVQLVTKLFDGFVSQPDRDVEIGDLFVMINAGDVGVILLWLYGIEGSKQRANRIIKELKAQEELFWLYAVAQREILVDKYNAKTHVSRLETMRTLLRTISQENFDFDKFRELEPEIKELDNHLESSSILGIALQFATLRSDRQRYTRLQYCLF